MFKTTRNPGAGGRIARSVALAATFAGLASAAGAQQSISHEEKVRAFSKNVSLLGIPAATVAPDGLVFAAVAFTDKRNGVTDDWDGSAAFGFGVGVGDDLFDLQFTAHVTSLDDDFGDSGFLGVRASKRIDSGGIPTYLGLGVRNIAPWGDADVDDDLAYSGSITSFPVARIGGDVYPLMLTVGAGNKVRDFDREAGVFAGLGIGLTEYFGTSVAYNGDNMDVGASFRLPGLDSVGFNVILNDAFDQDDRQRVIFSLNWIAKDVF
ncbi:hypothetical protein R3X27_10460 [Tropicimonas sp. TH_r6]|uniref:hypothetical protein n=1 Tax=Tropicimonas sp. TH_r6 TaxID=3082085 RepID=UPI0029529C48|nr:hypothetical protein [Tropicimonas sp. TH_r6]MDV7143105.1 hypothetical protein [Tropicimonas sp. TH_r6]